MFHRLSVIWLKTIPPSWPYLVEAWTKVDQFPINQPFRPAHQHRCQHQYHRRRMIKTSLNLSHGGFFVQPSQQQFCRGWEMLQFCWTFVTQRFAFLPIIDILSSAVPRRPPRLCKFSDFRHITGVFMSKLRQELFAVWCCHHKFAQHHIVMQALGIATTVPNQCTTK